MWLSVGGLKTTVISDGMMPIVFTHRTGALESEGKHWTSPLFGRCVTKRSVEILREGTVKKSNNSYMMNSLYNYRAISVFNLRSWSDGY